MTIITINQITKSELAAQLQKADDTYWNSDSNPIMTDIEYEKLKQTYIQLYPNSNIQSITQDYKNISLSNIKSKYTHDEPLLSLNKANDIAEIVKWINTVKRTDSECIGIRGKYDGIACKLYNDTKTLVTRGSSGSDATSGLIGDNISHLLPIISITVSPIDTDLIGELVVSNETFKLFRNTVLTLNGEQFVNPRAMASGVTNRIDITSLIKIGFTLDFVIYEYQPEISVVIDDFIDHDNIITLFEKIKYDSLYPLDGVVLKLFDNTYYKSLGSTSKYPRGSIAYKFDDISEQAVISNIRLQYGKGKITPVVDIFPTLVAGVTITKATAHNWANVVDLGLNPGDTITIVRSKDTIPYIVDKVKSRKLTEKELSSEWVPDNYPGKYINGVHLWCEYCQVPILYDDPELYCSNKENCKGSNYSQLKFAIKILGIRNIGDKTIEYIIDNYNVSNIYDLITLTELDICGISGYSVTKVKNHKSEINKLKTIGVTQGQLLASVNIPQCGLSTCDKISESLTIDKLIDLSKVSGCYFINEITGIPGIGETRAQILYEFFQTERNINLLIELSKHITIIDSIPIVESELTVYFTGKFQNPKAVMEKKVNEIHGYRVVKTITAKLDILVAADITSTKVKKFKQDKLNGKYEGLKILTIAEFEDIVKSCQLKM